MTSRRINPAIYAGLTGAAAWWAQAEPARALTLFGQEIPVDIPVHDAGFTFVAGCVVGAVVASGTSFAIARVSAARAERRELEAQAQVAAGSAKGASEQARKAALENTHTAHRAQRTESAWERKGEIRVQPVSSGSAAEPFAIPARAAASARMNIPAVDDARGNTTPNMAEGATPRPYEAPKPYQPNSPYAQASTDYADIAEDYVRKLTLAERMASRAKGVAEVLSERLGGSRMEGLPVIERADGTVGDVGEIWWDSAFDEDKVANLELSFKDVFGGAESVPNAGSAQRVHTPNEIRAGYEALAYSSNLQRKVQANPQGKAQLEDESYHVAAAQRPQQMPSAPRRVVSSASVRRAPSRELLLGLPFVSEADATAQKAKAAASAEPRWTGEQQDLWAVALSAMDEKFKEQVAMGPDATAPAFAIESFEDEAGGASTLDEPGGLEPSTQFMAFKPQANHPEVNDTGSYIDLLLNQELSKVKSREARKSFREHLRLIDGTGEMPARHLAAQA